MKMNELYEATGPKEISTGKGKIKNPAYFSTFKYEGDPEEFNFGAQTRNYTDIKNALKRNGKKLTYIGVATASFGPDIFVAVAPDFVWYKYEGNTPGGGQNHIFINGVKIKTTGFVSMDPHEQDQLIGGNNNESAILDFEGDTFRFLKELLKSNLSNDQITNTLDKNAIKILDNLSQYSFTADTRKSLTNLASLYDQFLQRGIQIKWLKPETFITNKLFLALKERYNIPTQLSIFAIITELYPDLKDFFTRYLDAKKPLILKDLLGKNSYYNNNPTDIVKHAAGLKSIGINWKEVNDVLEDHKKQKNVIMKEFLEFAMNGDIANIKNIMQSLQLAGFDWPELDFQYFMEKYKNAIITSFLKQLAHSNYRYGRRHLESSMKTIIKNGIKWPELKTILSSIDSDKTPKVIR